MQPAIKSERLAWKQRGYDAGFKGREKEPPSEEPARSQYLQGHRIGARERMRAKAEGRGE